MGNNESKGSHIKSHQCQEGAIDFRLFMGTSSASRSHINHPMNKLSLSCVRQEQVINMQAFC